MGVLLVGQEAPKHLPPADQLLFRGTGTEGFQALGGIPSLGLLFPALVPTRWAASPAPPGSPRNVKR